MKFLNRIMVAFRMSKKNCIVSTVLFAVGFICFSLFGRMWTEYRNSDYWKKEYQKIQNFTETEMQYLECTRFVTQEYELNNNIIADMFDELRALNCISWFGSYQYNGLSFQEFLDRSYLSYARNNGSNESDDFLKSGYVRTIWIYGDAWNLCKIRMVDGSNIMIPDENEESIPIIAGYEFRNLLHKGDILHNENKSYRVIGIMEPNSRYLINGAHKGMGGYINLDWTFLVGASPDYYSGSYNNFRESIYFTVKDKCFIEDAEDEILSVLESYGYHGWIESVANMEKKIKEEQNVYTQHRRTLCVLIVLIAICSIGSITMIEMQNSKYTFGIWSLCGINLREIQQILVMRYMGTVGMAYIVSLAVEGMHVYQNTEKVNYGAVIEKLDWNIFCCETVYMTLLCVVIVLIVVWGMCYFLLKNKSVMELMAEKEVS